MPSVIEYLGDQGQFQLYVSLEHMKKAEICPTWYFVDEAGDPFFYGAGKKIIVGRHGWGWKAPRLLRLPLQP